MKRLPFYFWVSLALASCQGGKEAVNQALPVIDMNEDYPEKEIVLQDIADISYIPLETNDEFLFDGSVEVVTDQYVITKGHRETTSASSAGREKHSTASTGSVTARVNTRISVR